MKVVQDGQQGSRDKYLQSCALLETSKSIEIGEICIL